MTAVRTRSLLAAGVAAAVFAYGLGHGLPQLSSHEGMAGAAAGLCLLLVTAIGSVAVAKPTERRPVPVPAAATMHLEPTPRTPVDARERASPQALQRFLN